MPSQYIGNEFGAVIKQPGVYKTRVLLAFPDTYEIGMSYLGYRILYRLLNNRDDIYAERVFAPWPDLEKKLLEEGKNLFSLETRTPLKDFDIVGISLQYELGCTNILTMLHLGGIPLRSIQRNDKDPLVIAGGPVTFNPEPFSPFFDLFFIGDGEEGFLEIIDKYQDIKRDDVRRDDILESLAAIKSVYVPALTKIKEDSKTGMLYRTSIDGKTLKIERRILDSFDKHPFPADLVVPYGKVVQDKVSIELNRGCSRGCRFCQAGYIYLPSRERNLSQVMKTISKSLELNGYDEISLTGLSPTDYIGLEELISNIRGFLLENNVSLSISSLRSEKIPDYLLDFISSLRLTGFTLAPEAGTQRMRDIINKNLTEEEILDSIRKIYSYGWRLIKLYFMIGLPTETDDDVIAITDLAEKALHAGKLHSVNPGINLSVSPFVPKPHTPFQWERMDSLEDIKRKLLLIKRKLHSHSIEFKHHKIELSFLEGLLARGDSKLADVIEKAWRKGARFDGWSDFNNFSIWQEAINEAGIIPEHYLNQISQIDSHLPWDHIITGVDREFLLIERDKAMRGKTSNGCVGAGCRICGVCNKKINSITDCRANINISGQDQDSIIHNPKKISVLTSPTGNLNKSREYQIQNLEQEKSSYEYTAFYSRTGLFKYLSHFDVMRTLIRALKRAGVNFSYTKGFHPKPIISFPPPLPVGVEGLNEIFDFTSSTATDVESIIMNASSTLPQSFKLIKILKREQKEPLSTKVKGALFSAELKDQLAFETIRNYNIIWEDVIRGSKPVLFKDENKGRLKEKDLKLYLSELKIDEYKKRLSFSIKYTQQGSINPLRFLKSFFREIVTLNTVRREILLFE